MNILVVGGGSIGLRHAENLSSHSNVCLLEPEQEKINRDLSQKVKVIHSIRDLKSFSPDGILICVPTHLHIDVATHVAEHTSPKAILIEKPISHTKNGVCDFLQRMKDRNISIFVVNNMRFHPGPSNLKRLVEKIGKIYYARAEFGNYLPNMRPTADYRSLYAAKREHGGGALLDCIHELDYLIWIMGKVSEFHGTVKKLTDLNISAEDYAAYHLTHTSGAVSEVKVDFIRRLKKRGCEVVGENGIAEWLSRGKEPEKISVRYYDYVTKSWIVYEDRNMTREDSLKSLLLLDEKFLRFLKYNEIDGLLAGDEALEELDISLKMIGMD